MNFYKTSYKNERNEFSASENPYIDTLHVKFG